MNESTRPSENQIASWKMKWQELHGAKPTQQQIKLDDLAATFMLSGFGRSSEMFESVKPWLSEDNFKELEQSRENHLYLQRIACKLLDDRDPHFLEIGQIITLISDFDILTKHQLRNHPYINKFEGVYKFYHSDFNPLRKSLRGYWENVNSDPNGLGRRANETILERFAKHRNMIKAQDMVDKMVQIVNLDYRPT